MDEEDYPKNRRPAFNIRGQLRGFRSRPGAPQAKGDSMVNLGVAGDANSPDRQNAWDSFFNKPKGPANPAAPADPLDAPELQSDGYVAGRPLSWKPGQPTNPESYTSAAVAGNSAWMSSRGLAFPPPPRPLDRSLPAAPFTPSAPGGKLNWSSDPMAGQAGISTPAQSRAGLAYNKSLYEPGSTAMATLRGAPAKPSQWITASNADRARIAATYSATGQPRRFAGR